MKIMRITAWMFHTTEPKHIILSNIIKKNGWPTTTQYRVGNQWRRENQEQILEIATVQSHIIPKIFSIVLTVSAVNSRLTLIKPTKSSKMSIRIISHLFRYLKVQTSKLWREMLISNNSSIKGSKQRQFLRQHQSYHIKVRLTCPSINTAWEIWMTQNKPLTCLRRLHPIKILGNLVLKLNSNITKSPNRIQFSMSQLKIPM